MYLMYVDESGDCGKYDPKNPEKTGSKYFVLCGVFFHVNKWKITLETFKAFRKKIAREALLPYNVEFHCAEMISPHSVQAFTQISIKERWDLIKDFAEVIGENNALKIVNVVIDKKKTSLKPEEYLKSSINALYSAFDEYLRTEKLNGFVFLDRANEKVLNTHVRKILGTGGSGMEAPSTRIAWIIEDPIFKISADSFFIQSADVVAYALKEKLFPIAARRKVNADRIFDNKLSRIIFQSSNCNEQGIIHL